MKNIFKLFTLLSVLAVTACSSTGDTEGSLTPEVASEPTQTEVQVSSVERDALATTVFYFDFNSDNISAEDRATLVYHADKLKGSTDLSIRLEGHASEEGTREYNLNEQHAHML